MLREVFLLYSGVLISITVLFHLRGIPFVKSSLSAVVAALLIYPAYWHVQKRKLPVVFFERTGQDVVRSLKYFTATAGIIFPVFLGLAAIYQTQIFHLHFNPGGFRWNWNEVAIQLLLIALPEEFFFRGYLQTMLTTRFSKTFHFLGIRFFEMPWAIPLTCVIFALSHSIIALKWWHFAIFFPSLAFGWLRYKTNGLIAPILFHAASNLVMNQIGHFFR